jgi:pyridine nucleotide-disulfide oxidoreductase family protein
MLLGGGHAHVHVLKDFAAARPAAAEVLLVTPYPRQIYSGMVPGFVAGHYSEAQCVIPLEPLARAAGVMTAWGAATALDAAARTITLADGRVAEYDVLSIDTGSVIDRDRIPGAREHGLFVRPMEHFVKLYDGLVDLAARRVVDVVVLGGGAAGVELAMALAHRLAGRGEERARIALVTGGPEPLAGYPGRVMALARAALAAMRVTVFRDACAEVQAGAVLLRGGARLACDAPIVATGADAPRWLQGSGLALDERGFVLTGPTLQSRSHDAVFAAGDVATRADAPHAKSGVYAVRAGPPLALNLRRAVAGGALLPHQPQPRTLNLVSCGARRAIVSWGGLGLAGRWAWWWKDRIDRAFIARYAAAAAAGSGLTGPSAGS